MDAGFKVPEANQYLFKGIDWHMGIEGMVEVILNLVTPTTSSIAG